MRRPNAGWLFKGFTPSFALELFEIREMFELRLDGERLHVGRLIGPFTGNFLSTSGLKKQDLLDLDRKFPGLIILHIE